MFQLSQEQGTGQQHVLPPSLHAQGRTWSGPPSRPPNPTLLKKLLLTPALAPQPWPLLLRGLPTSPSDVALTATTVPGGEELWLLVGKGTLSREATSSQGRRRQCWEQPRAGVSRSRATTPALPALSPRPPLSSKAPMCLHVPALWGSLTGQGRSAGVWKGRRPCPVVGSEPLQVLSCPVAFCA